jgi:hypothetical protein
MDLDDITELEQRYNGAGERTLGQAYEALLERFEHGSGDREICLRLMFLAWYSCSEPSFLTGLPEDDPGCLMPGVFRAAFEELGGELSDDPELLFTAGLMASMFPYCCGPEHEWSAIGTALKKRHAALPAAARMAESAFVGRGAYGEYFAHMVRVQARASES